jgi:hypothetical protein
MIPVKIKHGVLESRSRWLFMLRDIVHERLRSGISQTVHHASRV